MRKLCKVMSNFSHWIYAVRNEHACDDRTLGPYTDYSTGTSVHAHYLRETA